MSGQTVPSHAGSNLSGERPVRVAMVTGEVSGDILGAGLMRALQERFPQCRFEGIGGERMLSQGFHSFFSQDRLAVMGLVEPLKRLPELLRMRRFLREHFLKNPPDVFIGIDSPDFNLDLELALRQGGVKTAHYVSPSVWAWRQGRVKKIAKAVDLMLTLLPFEADFYQQHKIPVAFVGHPLADQIPLETDSAAAKQALSLDPSVPCVALLPGSRANEVELLGRVFLETAQWCLEAFGPLQFVVPSANPARHAQLQDLLSRYGNLPVRLVEGQSQRVMAAADVVLMASGTTSLEALLLKRPMVIAYKMAPVSFAILSRLVKVESVGLPNLLAGRHLVPELLQNDATPEILGAAVLDFLRHPDKVAILQDEYLRIHRALKQNADNAAAEAISRLIICTTGEK
jgi:lipid-A-disaccharide synthase